MTLEKPQAQGRGWEEAQCLETWGASGVRTEAEGVCLAPGCWGRGIKEVLCLPRIEVQMPMQHPYLSEDPLYEVNLLGAGNSPIPATGGTSKNVPLPDFIILTCGICAHFCRG